MSDLAPLKKPENCPKCGGKDVRRIVGGRPNEEGWRLIERGEAVPGSCFLSADWPDWHCAKCHHQWFVKDDPARQEAEHILAKIMRDAGREWPNQPLQGTPAKAPASSTEPDGRRS